MRTMLGIVGTAILLVSCTITKQQNDPPPPLNSWQGKNVNALIDRFGKPDYRVKYTNGHSLLAYTIQRYSSNNTTTSPQIGVNNPNGRPVMIVTPPNYSLNGNRLTLSCTILFEINEKGVIVHTQKRGANCA